MGSEILNQGTKKKKKPQQKRYNNEKKGDNARKRNYLVGGKKGKKTRKMDNTQIIKIKQRSQRLAVSYVWNSAQRMAKYFVKVLLLRCSSR